ncbi:MAG: hypothetical protein WBM72_00235 [Actinomycetota bacterium]
MRIGRRPLFFTALALLSLLLLEPTPAHLRWVNLGSAALAMFWAVALFLEDRSMLRSRPGPEPEPVEHPEPPAPSAGAEDDPSTRA